MRSGKGYWNAIRRDFPEVFESRAKLERELGAHIIKDCYLDELDPSAGRMDEVSKDRPEMPEYVYDVHTRKGKMSGKTKADFFVEEDAALYNRQQSLFPDVDLSMY